MAAVTIGAILLAACGASGGSGDAPIAAPQPDAPSPATNASAGEDVTSDNAAAFAAAFSTTTPLDGAFDGATLAGTDAVVWFWAPWCTICRAEAPDVNEIVERYGDRVNFVGVAGRGELDEMQAFIDDTDTSGLTHVADLDGGVWNAFGVYAQPAFAFIDDSGDIEVFIGGLRADDLAERIDALLAT